MNKRDNLVMAAIGAATSLLVIAVYIAFANMGVKPGEWLQFSAVFLGVAATISGTLWLQSHSERQRAARRVTNLIRSISIPRAIIQDIADSPTKRGPALIEAAHQAFEHVRWARSQLEAPSYRTHAIVEVMLSVWQNEKEELSSMVRTAGFYPNNPAPNVTTKANEILEWVDSARDVIIEEERVNLGDPSIGK